tara:strand:- start:1627 stop:2487 length:861 start_codon:yes stop_codon:yes gene_type:complete
MSVIKGFEDLPDRPDECSVAWNRTNKTLNKWGTPGFGDSVTITVKGASFSELIYAITTAYVGGANNIDIPRPPQRRLAVEEIEAICFAEEKLMGLVNPHFYDGVGNDLEEGSWLQMEIDVEFTLPEILERIKLEYSHPEWKNIGNDVHQWVALAARLSYLARTAESGRGYKDRSFVRAVGYKKYCEEVHQMGEKIWKVVDAEEYYAEVDALTEKAGGNGISGEIAPGEVVRYPDETYCRANPEETILYAMLFNQEFHIPSAMSAKMDIVDWYKARGKHDILDVLEI